MPVQTSYSIDFAPAFAGMLADLNDFESLTALLEGAQAIPFGIGLTKGAADQGYRLPAAPTDLIAGIGIHTHARDNIGFSAILPANAGVKPGQIFTVLYRGFLYVQTEEAVSALSPVFCRFAAGAGGVQPGAFRASADTNTAAPVKGARFLSSGVAGSIVKVSFDALVAGS